MKKIISLLLLSSFCSLNGFSMNELYGEGDYWTEKDSLSESYGEGDYWTEKDSFEDHQNSNDNDFYSSTHGRRESDFPSDDVYGNSEDQSDYENTSSFFNDDDEEPADTEDNEGNDEGGEHDYGNGPGEDPAFGSDVFEMFSEEENDQNDEQEFNDQTTSNIPAEQAAVALIAAKMRGNQQDEHGGSERENQPRKLKRVTSQKDLGYTSDNKKWKEMMPSLNDPRYVQKADHYSLDDNYDPERASLPDPELAADGAKGGNIPVTKSFEDQWFGNAERSLNRLYQTNNDNFNKPWNPFENRTDNKTYTNTLEASDNQASALLPDTELSQEDAAVLGPNNGQTGNQVVNDQSQQSGDVFPNYSSLNDSTPEEINTLNNFLSNQVPAIQDEASQNNSNNIISQKINNLEEQDPDGQVAQQLADQALEQGVTNLRNERWEQNIQWPGQDAFPLDTHENPNDLVFNDAWEDINVLRANIGENSKNKTDPLIRNFKKSNKSSFQNLNNLSNNNQKWDIQKPTTFEEFKKKNDRQAGPTHNQGTLLNPLPGTESLADKMAEHRKNSMKISQATSFKEQPQNRPTLSISNSNFQNFPVTSNNQAKNFSLSSPQTVFSANGSGEFEKLREEIGELQEKNATYKTSGKKLNDLYKKAVKTQQELKSSLLEKEQNISDKDKKLAKTEESLADLRQKVNLFDLENSDVQNGLIYQGLSGNHSQLFKALLTAKNKDELQKVVNQFPRNKKQKTKQQIDGNPNRH